MSEKTSTGDFQLKNLTVPAEKQRQTKKTNGQAISLFEFYSSRSTVTL